MASFILQRFVYFFSKTTTRLPHPIPPFLHSTNFCMFQVFEIYYEIDSKPVVHHDRRTSLNINHFFSNDGRPVRLARVHNDLKTHGSQPNIEDDIGMCKAIFYNPYFNPKQFCKKSNAVFTRVSALGAHLILGSQGGREGGAH